ncbi:MAG: hypothetical protein HONDAALG_02635 [Gammaproteobacteria bacterium]|nr:hypothetical protein [Gammaproteobacteria bacterium]
MKNPEFSCSLIRLALAITLMLSLVLELSLASAAAQGGNADSPDLMITSIPEFGSVSSTLLRGRVTNISADRYSDYKVAVLIAIEGLGYYSKPFCTPLFTPISTDGTWSANIVTGGVDQLATVIVSYLVRSSFQTTCVLGGNNLSDFDREAIAKVVIHRDNPLAKTLIWSGIALDIKESPVPVDPGGNLFRADNVFVGDRGYLHLRLTKTSDRRWQAGEGLSRSILGRGRYVFYVETPADQLPPNATLGLYTFGFDPTMSHREIDIELGRFGNPNAMNAQFVIQPFTNPNNIRRFDLPAGQRSVLSFDWQKDRIAFKAMTAAGVTIQEWTYPNAVLQLVDERLRFNLWSVFPSSDEPDSEAVISKFEFFPEPASVASLSAANYSNAYGIARDSIVAAFGVNLATVTLSASSLELPTSLGGTTVRVKDRAGIERLAPIFFVSLNQVNYLLPPGTAAGKAEVTITNGNGVTSAGAINVIPVAPALFSADASGQGLAAAVVLRVRADGSQVYEPVARFDEISRKFVAVPIDLGSSSDKVFLVLFGTGIRWRQARSTVKVMVGGRNTDVDYAGPQGILFGLDQVNALIPRELQGRGDVDTLLNVDGQISNKVMINIR